MKIGKNVFFLGIVSFFTDVSSEMIYPLIPMFLKSVIGASFGMIGLIEGLAESTASLLKVFSGYLSDRLKRRKPLVVLGYSVSTIAKPSIGFTSRWWHVLLLRFSDRVGKGIRTSPRDALIAESAEIESRGAAFGFHRALDTLGAVVGPLVAFLLLKFWPAPGGFRKIFFLSFIPGFIAILVLVFFVHEVGRREKRKKEGIFRGKLPMSFFVFLLPVLLFSIGNSSDAFVILRARHLGLNASTVTALYMFFNIVYAVLATPLGALSDKVSRRAIIAIGWIIYSLVYFLLAISKGSSLLIFIFALYGLYYALTEGVLRAMVADYVEEEVRGTAYGIFHTVVGIALLPASLLAGFLWDRISPEAPFYLGGTLSLLSSLILLILPITAKSS